MFHELPYACLFKYLQPAIREPRGLTGVKDNMPCGWPAVQQQAFTDM